MNNNILLIYGGNSVEHEISIITAVQLKKIYKGKYNLLLCYLKDGEFYFSSKLCNLDTYKKPLKNIPKISFKANKNYFYVKGRKISFLSTWVVAHGANCEDGTLSSYFKTLHIDTISQPLDTACIGQNKILTKKLCSVPIIDYFEANDYLFSYELKHLIDSAHKLSYPLVLKPSNLGSSIGVKTAQNTEELIVSIEELLHLTREVIIEKHINKFVELNVAIISYKNELIVSEIEKVSSSKILSYDDKYVNNSKSLDGQKKELPAKIDEKLRQQLIDYAMSAYTNLKCKYIVRFDFIYDEQNDILYLNEINNIPGSLALYLFEKIGIEKNKIIDMYLDQGLEDLSNEKTIITSYEQNILKDNNFNFFKTIK